MADFRAVVCGGGIAAVEGILRLRRLAGDSVHITMVAPNDDADEKVRRLLNEPGVSGRVSRLARHLLRFVEALPRQRCPKSGEQALGGSAGFRKPPPRA